MKESIIIICEFLIINIIIYLLISFIYLDLSILFDYLNEKKENRIGFILCELWVLYFIILYNKLLK